MINFNRKNLIIKPIPFIRLLPNLVTLIGLIIGISSIRFALDSRWETAVYCILIATIIDGVDGRVARLFNATSHFGAELDSLCDFVNFGFCPAMLVYLWSFQQYEYKVFSWASITLFVVCMAIRLARFNTTIVESNNVKRDDLFFCGIPAPGGAILALIPMILDFEFSLLINGFSIKNYTFAINIYIAIIALLLASRLPTISLKNFHIKPKYISLSMIISGVIIITTVIYPWFTLPIVALLYMVSIPICVYVLYRS